MIAESSKQDANLSEEGNDRPQPLHEGATRSAVAQDQLRCPRPDLLFMLCGDLLFLHSIGVVIP